MVPEDARLEKRHAETQGSIYALLQRVAMYIPSEPTCDAINDGIQYVEIQMAKEFLQMRWCMLLCKKISFITIRFTHLEAHSQSSQPVLRIMKSFV